MSLSGNDQTEKTTASSSGDESDAVTDIYLLMQSGPLYESTTEKVIMVVVVIIMLITGTVGNSLTVMFIIRDRQLHTPHMTAIAFQAGADLVHLAVWYTEIAIILLRGSTDLFNNYRVACCAWRTLVTAIMLGKTCSIGILALERLFYFRYPYLCVRVIGNKTIIISETVIYLLSAIMQLAACASGVSYYSVTNLSCSLYSVNWYFPTAMTLFLIPSGFAELLMVVLVLLQVFSVKREIAAQRSHAVAVAVVGDRQSNGARVHPLSTTTSTPARPEHNEAPCAEPTRVDAGQRMAEAVRLMITAIKLVGSMSLTYWLLYIPSMIVIFHALSRVSLVDMELGKQPLYRYLFRGAIVFSLGMVRVLTPFFHYLFVPALRQALTKFLRLKT